MTELKRRIFEYVFCKLVPNSLFVGDRGWRDRLYVWFAAGGM